MPLTKEELLEKGISEEVADEIIASFDDKQNLSGNPLEMLEKALSDTKEDTLFKAAASKEEEEPDEDEDEEYDEKFMKKMKRYMKSNNKKMVGLEKAESDMKKAVDNINTEADGVIAEMEDVTPVLNSLVAGFEALSKAVSDIDAKVNFISEQSSKGFDIMEKAAHVQLEQAKFFDKEMSKSAGSKGIAFDGKMSKASELQTKADQGRAVYSVLMKATQNKDRKAGAIISRFESSGRNINILTDSEKAYVNDLIKKEAN